MIIAVIVAVTKGEAIAAVREVDAFTECKKHCGSEHVGEEGRAELLCVDLCRLQRPPGG